MQRFILLLSLVGCDYDPEYQPLFCGDNILSSAEQCDDGNTEDGDGCSSTCEREEQYTVHWRTVSGAGAMHSCPAFFDVAIVQVQPVLISSECSSERTDCDFEPNGPELAFASPCNDGAELLQLPPSLGSHDAYRVAVELQNGTTGESYGETLSTWLSEVTDVIMYEDAGFVHLGWDLRTSAGGELDCASAQIDDVTINVYGNVSQVATLTVPCTELETYTPPIPVGVWHVDVVTSRATTTLTGVVVGRHSAVTELGPVTLTIP